MLTQLLFIEILG